MILEAVLLAMTDAQYKFLGAMVRSLGSNADCGMLNDCQLPKAIERKTEVSQSQIRVLMPA